MNLGLFQTLPSQSSSDMAPMMMPDQSLFTATTDYSNSIVYNANIEQGSRMNDLQRQLTNLQHQISANMTHVNVMDAKINQLLTENQSMKENIKQLESENQQLKKLETKTTGQLDKIKKENITLKENNDRLLSKKETLLLLLMLLLMSLYSRLVFFRWQNCDIDCQSYRPPREVFSGSGLKILLEFGTRG